MKELIIMGIYLIAFVIMLIIDFVYVNKKMKYLDVVKPLETKQEAINKTRELLQNIECEKCFNKNKTIWFWQQRFYNNNWF